MIGMMIFYYFLIGLLVAKALDLIVANLDKDWRSRNATMMEVRLGIVSATIFFWPCVLLMAAFAGVLWAVFPDLFRKPAARAEPRFPMPPAPMHPPFPPQ